MVQTTPTNHEIAAILDRIADLLDTQDASPFRVRAYRNGAQTVRTVPQSLAQLVRTGGENELEQLPNIGDKQAGLIAEYVHTGHVALLDRLQGEASPRAVFTQVPGIGPELAGRIESELHIGSLEDLEMAAHDGRLAAVEGFGPKRVQAVRDSLAGRLSQAALRRARQRVQSDTPGEAPSFDERPSVELLLKLDAEYRRRAAAGELRTIAPNRFNPNNEAWLPIMHAERQGWDFTVLFSNTARAHELDKTRDWVVIYYERGGIERQNTVVTETSGPLEGKRVVRGREAGTQRHYAQ